MKYAFSVAALGALCLRLDVRALHVVGSVLLFTALCIGYQAGYACALEELEAVDD